MAEEKLIDGHDAVWWKAQWDAMKAENDVLNPRLDAANAKLKTQELQIADLGRQLLEGSKAHEAVKDALATTQSLLQTGEKDHADTFAKLREQIALNEVTNNALGLSKQLAEKRRLALADLLKQHTDGIARLMPLVSE
jgi:uncharacterized phage infection (PIP) family protein YhgE